ncbi:hypothetical protein BHE74_00051146 [Ensete ventricosum]|nr:hypothetical protein BHE74_00051146 [Ensete ventricosum]
MPKVKKKRWWCGWEEQAAGEVEQRPQLVEEEEDSGWVQWLRSRDYGRTTFVILMEEEDDNGRGGVALEER